MKDKIFKIVVIGKAALTLGLLIYNSTSFAAHPEKTEATAKAHEIRVEFGATVQCSAEPEITYCMNETGCKVIDLCKGSS